MTRCLLSRSSVSLLIVAAGLGLSHDADAQRATPSRDSVLVARDLDGDGRIDYIVRQQRPRKDSLSALDSTRIVLFLNGAPRSGRPTLALPWSDALDGEQSLGKVTAIGSGASAVEVVESGGDFDGTTLLLVDRGTVRKVLSHGVDYGNGYFYLEQNGTVIDATVDNLMLNGKPVGASMKCAQGAQAAALLRFDAVRRNFVVERTRCSRRR